MSKAKQSGRARSKSATQKPDGRKRSDANALDHHDRRNLWEAFRHGIKIGFPPTCTIDFHPVYMDEYPTGELAGWFKDELRNRITTWLRRRKVGWYAIWVRENYVGDRREHLHLMIHCPVRLRADLKAAIEKWYPGNAEMVAMGTLTWRTHPFSGRVACPGFEYRLKQMTSRAQGPPRIGRPRREVKSRHDGSAVAPVSGLRCGVSRALDQRARQTWEGDQDAQQVLPGIGAPTPAPKAIEDGTVTVDPT